MSMPLQVDRRTQALAYTRMRQVPLIDTGPHRYVLSAKEEHRPIFRKRFLNRKNPFEIVLCFL